MNAKSKNLFDRFLFCLIIPAISVFLILVLCSIIIITLPTFFLFWINPVFELYWKIIWKMCDALFALDDKDIE
nr:MAG TPA: hypothetical protein [Caudoviricetes sp.]